MTSLVRVEWLKMRKYNAFWWIMGLTALAYPGITLIFYFVYKNIVDNTNQAAQLAKMAIGNPFTFPEAWHTITYFSSWFIFIPAVVVIMLISNEYSFRTHRQNIIDGWSRKQFITSKLIDVALISLIITILCAVAAFITGMVNEERLIKSTWDQVYYVGLFALQTFSQLTLAFLVGFLVRKAFIALGIFIFYFFPFEPIIINLLREFSHDQGRFFMPLEISDRMIPVPAFLGRIDPEAYQRSLDMIPMHVGMTVILTTLMWGLCYWINSRKDLK
jgi:ABC-2 type transport system permease protein